MSMNEERIMILKMLEEGKITSDDAAKLLQALGATANDKKEENSDNQKQNYKDYRHEFHSELKNVKDRMHEWKKEFKKEFKGNQEWRSNFKSEYNQKDFERIIDDFASKSEKLGKNLAVTTFGIVDKVIDFVGSFVDTNTFNMFSGYKAIDKVFETVAVSGMELSIEGLHGHIIVKKSLDDRIVIRSRVRSPQNNVDDIVNFEDNGTSLNIKLNKIGHSSVAHEILLPAVNFKSIKLVTVNAKIHVEDSISESIECITKNADIYLTGVNSQNILIKTANARIQLGYVIGKDVKIETSNSVIDFRNIKAQRLEANNLNGRILAENVQCSEGSNEIFMLLKTSNGGIKLNMNDVDNKGYSIKAKTINGGVNLLIPDLVYENVDTFSTNGKVIIAKSNGFDGFPEKVNVQAETDNGHIEIVK